ncbi:MAG: hypothetical protein GTN76_12790 [Candidatus Aenigmarchaeota archaeon]|nr:hypothetical protein [Candidatus Aenigmarchaeota archaeon]
MGRIYVPTTSPEDWRKLLADPEKHWRTGFSAKALAYCWEEAEGFPPEIVRLFSKSEIPSFKDIELLLAIAEYQVPLPGGTRPSQNDIFVLAKAQGQWIVIMVEGKVSESFGPTVGEWKATESKGRTQRLKFIKEQLGFTQEFPLDIRYQLLHRTASAVIEARRFNARSAAMLVHSFSQDDQGFEDYQGFLGLFGVQAAPNQLVFVKDTQGISLYCGWARGNPKYLEV